MKVFRGIILVFLVILHYVFCKESSNKWKKINTTDTTYGTSIPVEGQLSALQCLAKCSATTGCVSANVNRENLQCELSTDHPLNRSLTSTYRPGWSVYYTVETKTQWAINVTGFSSEYSSDRWSAKQVLGPPDVYPNYGDNGGAWALHDLDANQFIQVQFAEAVSITGVEVYETLNAGGVKAIKALDGSGNWTTLWSTATVQVITAARVFAPKWSITMSIPSRDVRIEIDCTASNSW